MAQDAEDNVAEDLSASESCRESPVKGNIPHTVTPPPPVWNAVTRQVASMDSCQIHQSKGMFFPFSHLQLFWFLADAWTSRINIPWNICKFWTQVWRNHQETQYPSWAIFLTLHLELSLLTWTSMKCPEELETFCKIIVVGDDLLLPFMPFSAFCTFLSASEIKQKVY